jgi:predicted metal-binding membrane protein
MGSQGQIRARDHGLTAAVALPALAAVAWAVTARRMSGMDMAPMLELGTLGWFAVTWVVMMAAMMLPSLVPAARVAGGPAAFTAGYLAAWTAAGLAAYGLIEATGATDLRRGVAVAIIAGAAAYQLTAAKGGFLDRCRHPAGGGLGAGLRHGAACVGCCVGLMAALFALGVMSLAWMAVVAALIAAERLSPRRAPAVYAVAAVLAALAIGVAAGL